jgi:5-methylcytosine-specific restriction endonuclease McrA
MPCAACGVSGYTVIDHIKPVDLGGTNELTNLQPLCRWCNGAKGARHITNAEILTLRKRTPHERQNLTRTV